jgi:hypothetical protein
VRRQDPSATRATLRERLEDAAAGLVYSSEGDHPFEFCQLDASAADWPPTAERFGQLVGTPAGTRVEERTLDDFFARHVENVDPLDGASQALRPRYDALRAQLRAMLRDTRVFRVGRTEVRCYVVGVGPEGEIAGLSTTAIET